MGFRRYGGRVPLLLVSGAAILALAGCGSGRLSEAAFRTEANRICARVNKQHSLPSGKAALVKGLNRYESSLVSLTRLRPPPSEQHAYRVLLGHMRLISSFNEAHESTLLAFDQQSRVAERAQRQPPKPKGARLRLLNRLLRADRQFSRIFQPELLATFQAAREASTLGLTACFRTRTSSTSRVIHAR